jgi:uncharacterized membrane protein
MKVSRVLISIGIILIILGIIFQSQGSGRLGPESSFMYFNKDWIYYGIGIAVCGIIVAGAGVFLLVRRH